MAPPQRERHQMMPLNLLCRKEMKVIPKLLKNSHVIHDRSYLQIRVALQLQPPFIHLSLRYFFDQMSAWVFLIHLFFYVGFYCSQTVLITYLFWDQQQWQWLCWDALEYLQLVISFNDPWFPYNRANTDCSLHTHKKWNEMILLTDLLWG